ncbi:MAG TPA: phytanoyl-CoA dioxygenase family protein [Polyangiaceae bacterium]|nr:phytanoyl-CoA dioxygenase family protein [Polyangiaceae bacterium]
MTLDVRAEAVDVVAAIAHFRVHGWARVGRVASDACLEQLRGRADDLMFGRVMHEGLFFQRDAASGRYGELAFGRGWEGPSPCYRKIEKLERDPLFRAWLENAVFERIVRAVVGDEAAIYRASLFAKSARGGTELPWHQDGGSFWGLDRDPELQIWTALDDVPVESGCVEVLDASHAAGLATPLGGNIPLPIVDRAGADGRKLALPALAGEVLLIHNYLWHRSGVNVTGRSRRAFTVAYMPASTRCLRRKRAPRSFVRVFEGHSVR